MSECYCAKIEGGLVTQVIVCSTPEWASQHLGGDWVCTQDRLVGIGWTHSEEDGFRPPSPYSSWVWSGDEWQAPTPQPDGDFVWSEEDLAWVPA